MRWYTAEKIRTYPSLSEAEPSAIPAIVGDSEALHGAIAANPGILDGELRVWAESAGIPPERFNPAAALLRESGQATPLRAGSVAPTASGGASSLAARVLVESLTAKDLAAAAKRVGAEVAKSATKEEQAAAIVEAVAAASTAA